MNKVKLGDVAEISISNVDKKTKEGEKQVRLCNFTDVYYNWAISAYHYPTLMKATASESAIEKFTLKKGDVAITKDSETRNDIGVATYISDNFKDMVLGYHCALIRPNPEKVYGKYLNVVLHTYLAQKYFEANASGSGQRYTLTSSIIENMLIPLPEMDMQIKIGDLMSTIDRRIENNNHINAELEAMTKTIYDYWFWQFDFPDDNGKPYKSSGGKMVWNNKLKRKIPEGWSVKVMSDIADMVTESTTPKASNLYLHYSIPAFDDSHLPLLEDGSEINSGKYIVPNQSILVSKLNPQFKRIWNVGMVSGNAICSTEFMPFVSTDGNKEFLYGTLNSDAFHKFMIQCSSSSTGSRKRMPPEMCLEFEFAYPNDDKLIEKHCSQIKPMLETINKNLKENQELASLRDFLLPLLMNGQVSIRNIEQ